MKTFQKFLAEAEASTSDTQSAISRSVSGGGSDYRRVGYDRGFKKLDLLRLRNIRLKQKGKDKEKQSDTSSTTRPALPYRYKAKEKSAVEKGGPLAKRPPSQEKSRVVQRTKEIQQPPQHKQISARPASTAMAGSRQRPAIKPAKSNLSRDNMGVQRVNVRDEGPTQQKQLSPSQQRQLPQSRQKQLAPARS